VTDTDEALDVDLDAWDAWSPSEAAHHLARLEAPWYVSAGWALDLFLGEQTREHDDLEIGVPSHRFPEVREVLFEFELVVIGGGKAWPLSPRSLARHHQTWVRERPTGVWRMDLFRESWNDDAWTFRRHPRVRLPAAAVTASTDDGIPFLQPEIVLLYKAKASRPKDEQDFVTVLPHLDAQRRAWLRDALALVHPGHRWLDELVS
jgi:hypothetical protein